MSTLFERITANLPTWAHETIQNWDKVFDRHGPADILHFVTTEVVDSNTQIDMREVCGQWEHYAGQTWLDAVADPQYKPRKMMRIFGMYDENPDYYWYGAESKGMYFSSLNGGAWFSDSGGNHRTVVAKFASEDVFRQTGRYPMVAGVSKHQYFADIEAWDLSGRLKAFTDRGIHISVERRKLNAIAGNGRTTTTYELAFYVGDYRFGQPGRSEWLSAREFCRFARHILRTDAVISSIERWRHYWRWLGRGDVQTLIYD